MESVAYDRIDEHYGLDDGLPEPELLVDLVDFMHTWYLHRDTEVALEGTSTIDSIDDVILELSVGRMLEHETWRRFCFWALHELCD